MYEFDLKRMNEGFEIGDFETEKKHLFVKVIERPEGSANEVISKDFLNLIGLVCVFAKPKNKFTKNLFPIILHKDICEKWGVSPEEVYKAACENTSRINLINSEKMSDTYEYYAVYCEKLGEYEVARNYRKKMAEEIEKDESQNIRLFARESGGNIVGLFADNDKLKEIAEKVKGSYYLTPLSIEEIVVTPEEMATEEELRNWKKKLDLKNAENFDLYNKNEIFSNLYFYNAETNQLEIAKEVA